MQTTHRSLFLREDARRFRRAAFKMVCFVAVLWLVWLVTESIGLRAYEFGVKPREAHGLIGVLTAPLLHGSLGHLVSNSLPLLILGTCLLYMYPIAARIALPVIWIGSGLAVWVIGRESYHIGASGVVYGIMFYIFVAGMLRTDVRSLALALMVFFLYGGMIWGVLPGEERVSFESHLAGAVIGLVLALLLNVLDRPMPEKRFSYEIEAEHEARARARGEPWPDPLDGLWRDEPDRQPEPDPLFSLAHLRSLLDSFRRR